MSEVQTLARGLKILNLLSEASGGLSSSELADTLDVDKAAMSRLMKTLVNYHYAERDEQSKRYYLGSHLHEMSRHAGQHAYLRELANPLLEQLNKETTENAHLAILSGDSAITIADVASTQTLRVVSEVGRRLPLHASAVGKCLLAFSEIPLPRDLKRYTHKTLNNGSALKLELEKIRFSSEALDLEELTLGVHGLATTVRNREGRVIASMGMSGPSVRLALSEINQLFSLLKEAATTMSAHLGYKA